MRLDLSTVTLVLTDTECHKLSRMAIDDCLKHTDFKRVLVFTDLPDYFAGLNCELDIQRVKIWPNKFACGVFLWEEVPHHITTDHALCIQWDSWIIDPSAWQAAFLNYDYIGAPWWHKDGLNVGNGGFSLRSKKLLDYVAKHHYLYPPPIARNEDDLLCRAYRGSLEHRGFTWAPEELAFQFAFERTRMKDVKTFGYHGIFNWPEVLKGDELTKRYHLAEQNDYIRNSGMLSQCEFTSPA